nr:hypothetical protein CFP56_28874 [Quercus suber]
MESVNGVDLELGLMLIGGTGALFQLCLCCGFERRKRESDEVQVVYPPCRDHLRKKTPELDAERSHPPPLITAQSGPPPIRETQTSPSRFRCRSTTTTQRRVRSTSRSEKPRAHLADFNAVPPPPLNVMSKGKEKMSTSKQFRWLPPMHEMMLRILAQEAAKGNKPSSTFRAGSFALVAKEISAQFGVECHPSYVDNRMCTLRTMWSTIEKLRKKSDFGWDDNLKMITCDAKTYQEEVMAHRKYVEFLNKKIEMYDELAIVVGKDTATGGFSKSYVDIENEPDNGDSAEFVADNVEEDVVEKATALKEINRGLVDYTSLYNEVMAMMADGYSEEMLAIVFNHLCENEKVARGFLAKNARLRKMCYRYVYAMQVYVEVDD